MIIDADCHVSSHKFDGLAITADELVEHMDRVGVDKALVWLKPPYDRDIEPENRAVYEAGLKYPDRLLGFGWANPRLGADSTLATVQRCYEEYGFYGVKFNGAQDDYVIDARLPEAQFLMVHMGGAGTPPLDRSAVETAAAHPNITLIGSAVDERAILGAIHTLGPERVCFGSDMPFRLMHVILAMYRAMLRDFDEADQAKVLGGNLARLLAVD